MRFLVVIPLFNKELSILRAIDSVLKQSYTNFELLVIDDGSTDDSLKSISSIKDNRIKVVSKKNKGVSATRNEGIEYAIENNFDNISFLDADDYWLSSHLEKHLSLVKNFPEATVYGSNYHLLRSNKLRETKFSNFENSSDQLLERFFKHNYFNSVLLSSTFSLKVSNKTTLQFYDPLLTHGEDTDYFIRLGINNKIAFSKDVTVIIDQSAENRSDIVNYKKRTYPDFSKYEEFEQTHTGLKKFLDLNRFVLTLFYRIHEDLKQSHAIRQEIDIENLSRKQKLLLQMNRNQLRTLKTVQTIFSRMGIRLRAGK